MGIKEVILESFSSGGWVRYNKTIARELGIEASICLGNIIDKNVYFNDNAFYLLREDIEFETALSEYQQRKAEKILKDKNLINITPVPQPNGCRLNYYYVDYDKVAEYLGDNAKTLKDKKEAKKEFYRRCILEVARLNNPMCPDEKNESGQVKKIHCNKTKANKTKVNKTFNNIPSIAWSDEPTCNDKVDSLDDESSASVIESAPDIESSALNLNYNASGIDNSVPFIESTASINTFPALEYEDEEDSYLDPVEAPAQKDNIKRFIYHHALLREEQNLPAVKYNGHVDRLAEVPNYVLETYLDSDAHLMRKFYLYCDDRTFDMDVRRYECNSDRSPSVMVNESVFRRFIDWSEK
jgi:hypothetical protein